MSLASYLLDPKYKDSTAATTAYLLGLTPEISEEEDKPLKFPSLPGISLPGISGPKIEGPSVSGPSITTPGMGTPSVGLPGATPPNLGLSGLDLSKLTGSLPSVTTSLPAGGIKAPELNLPLGLSGLNLSGLSGIDLSKLGLGDYSGVAGAALPAVKVGTQGVSFSPSLSQTVNIGEELAKMLGKSSVAPIASAGTAAAGALGQVGSALSYVAPLQTAYTVFKSIADAMSGKSQKETDKQALAQTTAQMTGDLATRYNSWVDTIKSGTPEQKEALYNYFKTGGSVYFDTFAQLFPTETNGVKDWYTNYSVAKNWGTNDRNIITNLASLGYRMGAPETVAQGQLEEQNKAAHQAAATVRIADAMNAAIQAHLKGGALYNG